MRFWILLLVMCAGCVPANQKPIPPVPKPDEPVIDTETPASVTDATKKLILSWADAYDTTGDRIGTDIKSSGPLLMAVQKDVTSAKETYTEEMLALSNPLIKPASDVKTPEEQSKWEKQAKSGMKNIAKQLRKAVGK